MPPLPSLPGRTSYSRLTPGQARAVLAVGAAMLALCMGLSLSSLRSGYSGPRRGPGDIALYLAEIERIRGGESFYDAKGSELRGRGYPTRSTFNWRTPLPGWLLAQLPTAAAGRAVYSLLALVALFSGGLLLLREGNLPMAAAGVVMLFGAVMFGALDDLCVMPELWSGALIVLSACCYGLSRPRLGWAAGLAALFFRELAAPYVLVCLGLAIRARRWKEALAWLGGMAIYAAFYMWHARQVWSRLGPEELAHAEGWVQFGGLAFVIAASQMNAYLLVLPQWVAAMCFPLALLGFAGWQTPAGERIGLTACTYVVTFGIVGQPFNQYWGCLFAPLLALGLARAPGALSDLLLAAQLSAIRGARRA